MDATQERAIIAEVKDGDAEAYRYLVERYHRGLLLHLNNIVFDGQLAEDIAQEAFLAAYQKLNQYNDRYAFSTWLYKIADNLAYRQLARQKRLVGIDELDEEQADEGQSVHETAERDFSRQAVQQAVARLPFQYRQVIAYYFWEGRSYEDIAAVMECPVGTVRTWLHRAKAQLRKELYGQI